MCWVKYVCILNINQNGEADDAIEFKFFSTDVHESSNPTTYNSSSCTKSGRRIGGGRGRECSVLALVILL